MFSLLSKITPVWTAALAVVFCLSISAKADAAEGDPCDLVAMSGLGDGREISGFGGGLHCVPVNVAEALDKCKGAGWESFVALAYGSVFVSCRIPVHGVAEESQDAGSCGIYASGSGRIFYPCAEAFGVGFNFPQNDGSRDQRFVYDCPDEMVPDPEYITGGTQACVEWDDEKLCAQLDAQIQPAGNGETVCSDIDDIDTFCITGSRDAFPCRGLLKHVRRCNFDYNRPAENPFFCGPVCGTNQVATGGNCECAQGFTEQVDGACAASAQ